MTERHPDHDLVLDLALGQLDEPQRTAVVEHLRGCLPCRRDHDELASAVEQTLAAVPRKEPPPGFDTAVLERIRGATGAEGMVDGPTPPRRGWTRRAVALVTAAAAALGVLTGAVVTRLLAEDAGEQAVPVVAAVGQPLRTEDGSVVGYVDRSWSGDGWSLVVNVTDGPDDARYVCRVVTVGGEVEVVGDWTIAADRGNSWVVPEPGSGASVVELVRPDDRVWARAELP